MTAKTNNIYPIIVTLIVAVIGYFLYKNDYTPPEEGMSDEHIALIEETRIARVKLDSLICDIFSFTGGVFSDIDRIDSNMRIYRYQLNQIQTNHEKSKKDLYSKPITNDEHIIGLQRIYSNRHIDSKEYPRYIYKRAE